MKILKGKADITKKTFEDKQKYDNAINIVAKNDKKERNLKIEDKEAQT